jgi:hypothetical protein
LTQRHGVTEKTKLAANLRVSVPLCQERDLARCAREIADIEAQLLVGAGDVEGLLQGLQDWECEKRMILEESHGRRKAATAKAY